MKIQERYFADGGLGHNNPSFAIYYHYTGEGRRASTRPKATSAEAPTFSPHGDLDCSRVRFTNIGTGAKVDEVESRKRKWLPSFISEAIFLTQTLTEIATNSEEKAATMRTFQMLNPDVIMFERFDANHGLSNIKLDAHNALPDIRKKTGQYLEEQETKDLLEEVGVAIATDYISNQPGPAQNTQAVDSATGESHQRMDTLQLTPGFSSLSSGPSSHSGHLETESQGLFPNHDRFWNGGQTPFTKDPAENFLSPDEQWRSRHDAQEDSGIDTTGPEI